jgi:predicted metal-dependent HD superfamily phosphohydrolase
MEPFNFRIKNPYSSFKALHHESIYISKYSFEKFLNRFLSFGRHYHTIFHFATMWEMHIQLWHRHPRNNPQGFQPMEDARKISTAILYHDVVYDSTSKSNEQESADMFLRESLHAQGTEQNKTWVYDAILATADHLGERPVECHGDVLREWFVGLDLASGMACPWDMFIHYSKMIRLEYSHLTDEEFDTGNKEFLKGLLDKPHIFVDVYLRELFEGTVRENISRRLSY